jgi:hypothetical protein
VLRPTGPWYFPTDDWRWAIRQIGLFYAVRLVLIFPAVCVAAIVIAQSRFAHPCYVTNVYREYPTLMLGGQVLTVTDSAGKALPTIASQHPPQTFIERVKATRVDPSPVRVPPGAHANIEVNVTAQYEFTTPGQYNLKFALKVPTPDDKAFPVAVTPEMSIQILPK